jgi:hypothetical protein
MLHETSFQIMYMLMQIIYTPNKKGLPNVFMCTFLYFYSNNEKIASGGNE